VVLPSHGLFQSADATLARTESPPLSQVQAPRPAQDSAQRGALNAIIKKRAQSNEDILSILEARDKLLRLKMTKSSVLATAVKTIGICPDMCPEKER